MRVTHLERKPATTVVRNVLMKAGGTIVDVLFVAVSSGWSLLMWSMAYLNTVRLNAGYWRAGQVKYIPVSAVKRFIVSRPRRLNTSIVHVFVL
jgi:hypothetical protein